MFRSLRSLGCCESDAGFSMTLEIGLYEKLSESCMTDLRSLGNRKLRLPVFIIIPNLRFRSK